MTQHKDIALLTASELSAAYASRALSPVEVTNAQLARIERLQPALNVYAALDPERALEAARESEARWQRGEAKSPLDGSLLSVKDLLHVRGLPTRFGSRTTSSENAEHDAPAVARLREAGAIVLGKTTTSEFGLKGFGDNPLTGITRNPWNLAHTPGGSSAGAVAATAAGLSTIALGTDGGGSIRVPSSYAGVVGLKPTWGRVATDPPWLVGVPPHVGPIARSVADVALVLRAISARDVRDSFQPPVALPAAELTLNRELFARLRIGYSATLGDVSADPEIHAAFERAISLLREAGAQLEEATPVLASPASISRTLFLARAAYTASRLTPSQRALLDPAIEAAARDGERLNAVDYLHAEQERIVLLQALARYHERFDLLLTPSAPAAAPRIDEANAPATQRGSFAAPFSLSRQPALSLPIGVTTGGLPIGLQIAARHFEEDLLLQAALVCERLLAFDGRPAHEPNTKGIA